MAARLMQRFGVDRLSALHRVDVRHVPARDDGAAKGLCSTGPGCEPRSYGQAQGGSVGPSTRAGTWRVEGPTKEQLYNEAKQRNIEGRSKMDRAELKRALGH